ncbi:hypothetical protein DPMN_073095 [Dreissena polymorpha]|uniref:Uncharacterized protein n=1 Tax=Dreissena polymorpha TaxID=45954 RepID=A0A9D4HAD9_DREPO|nr:hypothetical protein DPMN_073095 [Dreissena polymorpha]
MKSSNSPQYSPCSQAQVQQQVSPHYSAVSVTMKISNSPHFSLCCQSRFNNRSTIHIVPYPC